MGFTGRTAVLVLLAIYLAAAAEDAHCTRPGAPLDAICVSTGECSKRGGVSHTGYCSGDNSDIKCCDAWDNCQGEDSSTGCTWKNRCIDFHKGIILQGK